MVNCKTTTDLIQDLVHPFMLEVGNETDLHEQLLVRKGSTWKLSRQGESVSHPASIAFFQERFQIVSFMHVACCLSRVSPPHV